MWFSLFKSNIAIDSMDIDNHIFCKYLYRKWTIVHSYQYVSLLEGNSVQGCSPYSISGQTRVGQKKCALWQSTLAMGSHSKLTTIGSVDASFPYHVGLLEGR